MEFAQTRRRTAGGGGGKEGHKGECFGDWFLHIRMLKPLN